MANPTLNYQSPGTARAQRSISAMVSVVASALAIMVGLSAYLLILATPGQKTMFDGMAVGFVLLYFCVPAFVVAAIGAIVSARSRVKQKRMLMIAWLLLAVQGVFWVCLIAGSVMNAISPGQSQGAPGGF
jgi:hypothetical protein